MSDDWQELEAWPVPEDRRREMCYFVGGPADGDEREVPLCRHNDMADVGLYMPDGTYALYNWAPGEQHYRFAGIEYPHG